MDPAFRSRKQKLSEHLHRLHRRSAPFGLLDRATYQIFQDGGEQQEYFNQAQRAGITALTNADRTTRHIGRFAYTPDGFTEDIISQFVALPARMDRGENAPG